MKTFILNNKLLIFTLLVFAVAFLPSDIFGQLPPKTCTGANPTTKEAKIEITKPGAINIVPCDGQSVLLRGNVLNGSGTVSQVGIVAPTTLFDVTNSPVTTAGNLTLALKSQTQNQLFAAPTGANGQPGFRALVEADLPSFSATKIGSGTFDEARIPSMSAGKIATGILDINRIPDFSAAKTTSGTFDPARLGSGTASATTFLRGNSTYSALADTDIPNLNASKTNAGTFSPARLGSGTADATTFLRGNSTYSALAAGDLPNHSATLLTSGTVDPARLGSGTANATKVLLGNSTWGDLPNNSFKTVTSLITSATTLSDTQSGQIIYFFNTTLTLPANPTIGTNYTFVSYGNSTLAIKANSSQAVIFYDSGSQSAVSNTAQYSYSGTGVTLTMVYVTTNIWAITGKTGVWSFTT